jgi:hypothetical protein
MQVPVFSKLYVVVARDKIALLKFILEGYDGLASLSTVDSKNGSLVLRYFPDYHDDLVAILEAQSFDISLDANLENALTSADN